MGWPSISTVPSLASQSLATRAASVVFPQPVGPTTASVDPAGIFRLMSERTACGPHAVLSDINLKIPAGSTLAVVGPTGCGKTTLAALVARLWEAREGTVLIDGHPIQHWPLEALRRSIGYVPQDTYLFSETVGGNIAFGLPNYHPERVREGAEIA